ncbi:MAG: hypothetical protein AAGI14_12025 [Pseudomonadota bacterium]
MLKILKYIFIIWLVITVVGAPFYYPYARMVWVFNPMVSQPSYDTPATPTDARLQDIDYLRKFTSYDRAFTEDQEASFQQALDSLEGRAADLSDAEFYMQIAKAVGLPDNGHTNLSSRPQNTDFNTLGVRFYEFSDGLYIVEATSDYTHLLGQRVVSMESRPIEDVFSSLAPFKGGNEAWKRLAGPKLMQSPVLMNAVGLAEAPDRLTIEVEDADGKRTIETISAAYAEDPSAVPSRYAYYSLLPGEDDKTNRTWRHMSDAANVTPPRYLQSQDDLLHYDLPGNGYYIRSLGGFVAGDLSIPKAYNQMTSGLAEASLDYLVVDFRINDGGNYLKSMPFAKRAGSYLKPDGKLYIVTGSNTFSAGIVTVAMLKYYGGEKAQIIGEPIGDFERFWAESGGSFRLPNSGYYVYYATGLHDWNKGCKGEPYCFTMNEWHEVPAGSLAPSVNIETTFVDYAKGKDTVLDWVFAQHQDAP